MKELEVNCITAPPRAKHVHITHIGYNPPGRDRNSSRHNKHSWRLSVPEAIAQIESGFAAFFTVHRRSGIRAYLGVLREEGKPPCLKARAGSVWNDHLLTQTQCEKESE